MSYCDERINSATTFRLCQNLISYLIWHFVWHLFFDFIYDRSLCRQNLLITTGNQSVCTCKRLISQQAASPHARVCDMCWDFFSSCCEVVPYSHEFSRQGSWQLAASQHSSFRPHRSAFFLAYSIGVIYLPRTYLPILSLLSVVRRRRSLVSSSHHS